MKKKHSEAAGVKVFDLLDDSEDAPDVQPSTLMNLDPLRSPEKARSVDQEAFGCFRANAKHSIYQLPGGFRLGNRKEN